MLQFILDKMVSRLHPQGVRRGCKGLKPQQHTQRCNGAGGCVNSASCLPDSGLLTFGILRLAQGLTDRWSLTPSIGNLQREGIHVFSGHQDYLPRFAKCKEALRVFALRFL